MIFSNKQYGRTFSLTLLPQTPPPESVPKRVQSKLALFTPSPDLVEAYLSEIARGYGVPYAPLGAADDAADSNSVEGSDGDDDGSGLAKPEKDGSPGKDDSSSPGEKTTPPRKTTTPPSIPSARQPTVVKKRNEVDELAARFERLKNIR